MSAEILREAAALMRERAEAAPADSPWAVRGRESRVVDVSRSGLAMAVADVYPTGGSQQQRAMAEHVASWHPAVALAVADWLDRDAEGWELLSVAGIPDMDSFATALTVARTYLGRDQ